MEYKKYDRVKMVNATVEFNEGDIVVVERIFQLSTLPLRVSSLDINGPEDRVKYSDVELYIVSEND